MTCDHCGEDKPTVEWEDPHGYVHDLCRGCHWDAEEAL